MELIKTKKIGKNNLTIVYWEDGKTYEVQYTDDENILDYEDGFTNKKDALKMFNNWEKWMVIERLEE